MEPIEILLQFAAEKISAKEFENELHTNKDLEELLQCPTISWEGAYVTKRSLNLYYYLIELTYSRREDIANAIGALELFFERKGIAYTKTTEHSTRSTLCSPHNHDISTQTAFSSIRFFYRQTEICPKQN